MMKNLLTMKTAGLVAFILTMALPALARHEKSGYLYGKVTTRSGNVYTGTLRWGTEEAFWDDLFNSAKTSQPYATVLKKNASPEERDRMNDAARKIESKADKLREKAEKLRNDNDPGRAEELRRAADELREEARELRDEASKLRAVASSRNRQISLFGGMIQANWDDWGGSRLFVAKFGDIEKIIVTGEDEADLIMKGGKKFAVSGSSNDVSSDVHIKDAAMGDVSVPWKKIDTIEFMNTPANVAVDGTRIYGTVTTENGSYQGFVQWDCEECLTCDKLDGYSDDGKVGLTFGSIKKIERQGKHGCRVELKDGRKFSLSGTNDVDESNRGIFVEDSRYGKVKISWDSFDEVSFTNVSGSGAGYDEYMPAKEINGTATTNNKKTYTGRIVYDIDEEYSWEMINGNSFDIEFNIPFDKIATIRPRSSKSSEITLRNNEKLILEDTQDVSENNSGLLIFPPKEGRTETQVYLSWDELDMISFDW